MTVSVGNNEDELEVAPFTELEAREDTAEDRGPRLEDPLFVVRLEELALDNGVEETRVSGEEDEAPVDGDADEIFEGVAEELELGGELGIALLEAAEEDSLVDDAVADSSDALEDEVASVDVIVTESDVVVAGVVENVVNESEDGARDVDGSEGVAASEDDTDGDDDAGGSSSVGGAVLDSEPLMSSQRQTPKDGGKKRTRTRRQRRRPTRPEHLPLANAAARPGPRRAA